MNTFLGNKTQMSEDDVVRIASDCLRRRVKVISKISAGANSKVYHVGCSPHEYVVKFYFQSPSDSRDRLGVEFKSLSFLWDQGIRQIPQPLNAWAEQACALYALVEGVFVGQVTDADIDQAVDFLKKIKSLTKTAKSQEFDPASEALFCSKDIVDNLRMRLKRFSFENNDSEYLALREYLQNDFLPLLKEVEMWSKEYLNNHGVSWEQDLLKTYRTLSPSDFGFHNALRISNGKIVFLDFEYFGWDDPVKTVSDFLWHPAMNLTENLKQRFVNRMQNIFGDDPDFQTRLKALFPIFGLKWCLIVLNEFVVSDMQRRGFAQEIIKDKTALCLNQLAKAKALSDHIRQMYRDFPYGN